MENYELNIDSYSLEELLAVFKISLPLTDLSLENAKRKMLMAHPDKSGLNSAVFVFFKTAYERLKGLHDVQCRMSKEASTQYADYLQQKNAGLETFSKRSDFGAEFNKVFEQHVSVNLSTNGHGEWLAATTDRVDASTVDDLLSLKRESRALIKADGVVGWGSTVGSELIEADDSATSTLSGLAFQDVRDAYTNGVIAVTEEDDFVNRPKFSSVDELQRHRALALGDVEHTQHEEKLRQQRLSANMQDVEYAYKLQERDRQMRRASDMANASLLQIKGK